MTCYGDCLINHNDFKVKEIDNDNGIVFINLTFMFIRRNAFFMKKT